MVVVRVDDCVVVEVVTVELGFPVVVGLAAPVVVDPPPAFPLVLPGAPAVLVPCDGNVVAGEVCWVVWTQYGLCAASTSWRGGCSCACLLPSRPRKARRRSRAKPEVRR